MKKYLLALTLALSCAFFAGAQPITGINHTPVAPTTNDQVGIIIDSQWPYNCISDSFTVNITGNQIQIYMYQCLGMLSIICTKTDTVNVGQLPAGTYTVYVFASYAQAQPTCSMYSPAMPTNVNHTFTVSQFVSVPEVKNSLSLDVYPNPSSGNIYFRYSASQSCVMEIYDLVGQKVRSYTLVPGSQQVVIREGELKSGIYFAKVLTGNKETLVQKFTIIE